MTPSYCVQVSSVVQCDGMQSQPQLAIPVLRQGIDLVHAPAHLHRRNERVRAVHMLIDLPALEDVHNAQERHADNAHVGLVQQVDQGGHAAGIHQALDLHIVARSSVGNGPGALFADVKVLRLEHVRQCGDDVVVNNGLQLLLAAAADVGEGPAYSKPP